MSAKTLPKSIEKKITTFYQNDVKKDKLGKDHRLSTTSVSKSEALQLAKLVFEKAPVDTLEIGLAQGGSAIAIAAAKSALGLTKKHICLDPYQEKLSGRVGLLAIDEAGLTNLVTWLPEFSEDYLVSCKQSKKVFDLIFIDGGHSIGQAVTDSFLAHDALRPGGTIVIHDALMFSTMASVTHLIHEKGYKVVPLKVENIFKLYLRIFRYSLRLGLNYAIKVMPYIHNNLVAIQKPIES